MHAKNIYIRQARETDLEQLLLIENNCFSSDKINRRQMCYLLSRAKAEMFVAADVSDVVVGYGVIFTPQLNPQQFRSARLYSLAVCSKFRGRGLANQLLTELLLVVQQKGYRVCTLEVRKSDKATQLLYQRFGFKPVRSLPAYYDDGEDGLRMQLTFHQLMTEVNTGGEPCPSIS